MRWIAVAFALALAGPAAAQVAAPPVRIVEARTIDAGRTEGPLRLRLAAYTPAGGPWAAAEIDRATRAAAAILGNAASASRRRRSRPTKATPASATTSRRGRGF